MKFLLLALLIPLFPSIAKDDFDTATLRQYSKDFRAEENKYSSGFFVGFVSGIWISHRQYLCVQGGVEPSIHQVAVSVDNYIEQSPSLWNFNPDQVVGAALFLMYPCTK